MRGSVAGYLLIVAASVMWGTMGIFGKLAFESGIKPVPLTALRIVISSLTVFVPLALFKRDLLKVEKKDVLLLLVFGVFAVAFQRVAYFYTVDLTTATIAAVMFYTYPVFVTIYASVRLKEKITVPTVLAMFMAFSGVFLVVKAYASTWLGANLWGFIFGLLCSLLFALYFVVGKKLRNSYTNWTLLAYGDGIGAAVLAPALFCSSSEIASYSLHLWLLILVIALFPSLTAYLLFSYALKHVKSSKGSILSVVEPISAAIFSATILGETFEPLQLAGVALALTGITLLFIRSKPE
jgi:drug/metabolite transporter (DMT)-like permease